MDELIGSMASRTLMLMLKSAQRSLTSLASLASSATAIVTTRTTTPACLRTMVIARTRATAVPVATTTSTAVNMMAAAAAMMNDLTVFFFSTPSDSHSSDAIAFHKQNMARRAQTACQWTTLSFHTTRWANSMVHGVKKRSRPAYLGSCTSFLHPSTTWSLSFHGLLES